MRGIKERRYLTEKYQRKQVRLAYKILYDKPYDRKRYIRTEFARKRRFYDILRGNYVEWRNRWSEDRALDNGYSRHAFSNAELGRMRTISFNCCDRRCCPMCSNPRRGYGWQGRKERLTRQELLAELHLIEEIKEYRDETFEGYPAG